MLKSLLVLLEVMGGSWKVLLGNEKIKWVLERSLWKLYGGYIGRERNCNGERLERYCSMVAWTWLEPHLGFDVYNVASIMDVGMGRKGLDYIGKLNQ